MQQMLRVPVSLRAAAETLLFAICVRLTQIESSA